MLAATGLRAQTPAKETLPADVRAAWARKGVQSALANSVLAPAKDGSFHGETKATRAEVVIALAKLAKALETGAWKASPSERVPEKIASGGLAANWKQQSVSRYALAVILARFGDYAANGLSRPAAKGKNVGKSEAIPPKATVTVPRANPAYDSLVYLTNRRMLWPDSPLLKADDHTVTGAELSRALAQMATGLIDIRTELAPDEEDAPKKPNRPLKKP